MHMSYSESVSQKWTESQVFQQTKVTQQLNSQLISDKMDKHRSESAEAEMNEKNITAM